MNWKTQGREGLVTGREEFVLQGSWDGEDLYWRGKVRKGEGACQRKGGY